MQYDLTINPIKKVRKKKEINWRYKKTNTPKEDLKKFIKIKSQEGKFKDAHNLQIEAYLKVHEQYPLVRFYDFRKTARDVAFKFYEYDEYMCDEYYHGYNLGFTPDGYFFGWDERGYLDIFIIEVENTSRLTKDKINKIIDWWFMFDGDKATGLSILEFNRFGNYQRTILEENMEYDSLQILKDYSLPGYYPETSRKKIIRESI